MTSAAWKNRLAVAILMSASATHAQLVHKGPAAEIALSATLAPFDVITVKQNKTGDGSFSMNISDSNDRFAATNVPLKSLIEFAYDTKDNLITGLSGPVSSLNFDVEAKMLGVDGAPPVKLTDGQMQAMIIKLLADRFQLKAHLQTKILPVYDLIVLHGGPKFKLSEDDLKDNSWNTSRSDREISINFKGAFMSDLATALSDPVQRPVIDKTGLKGHSDLTLKWTDDAADPSGGPTLSVFTALEEQLGLKLQPAKGPVETLVIDHAEMPTQN